MTAAVETDTKAVPELVGALAEASRHITRAEQAFGTMAPVPVADSTEGETVVEKVRDLNSRLSALSDNLAWLAGITGTIIR